MRTSVLPDRDIVLVYLKYNYKRKEYKHCKFEKYIIYVYQFAIHVNIAILRY